MSDVENPLSNGETQTGNAASLADANHAAGKADAADPAADSAAAGMRRRLQSAVHKQEERQLGHVVEEAVAREAMEAEALRARLQECATHIHEMRSHLEQTRHWPIGSKETRLLQAVLMDCGEELYLTRAARTT